jgi:argininosuccinate lyase
MKIWEKGYSLDKEVEDFTVGDDHIIDMDLIVYDCTASKAHAKMLNSIGILSDGELNSLIEGLDEIISLSNDGNFKISKEDEDCHSAIESYLIDKCGEAGKKIHTGRSRNDQVLTAIRLFEKDALKQIKQFSIALVNSLNSIVDKFGTVEIPGYTHMQRAMPSSIGLWAKSFVDALTDQTKMVDSVYEIVDQSPLGTAAGFGVPVIELDKEMTAKQMGFYKVHDNPIYAQLSRGKFEAEILNACSQIMYVLNKLSSDLIMYSMSEFNFVSLPKQFCTGSSIMPQKINRDVLELVRAKYHVVIAEEFKIKSMIANLISGYNRDVQLTKKALIDSIRTTLSSLSIMSKVVGKMEVNREACKKAMTSELFATEKANKLVKEGIPFRQAYQKIAEEY